MTMAGLARLGSGFKKHPRIAVRGKETVMKQIQLNSKVSDKAPKVKFDLWTLVMAAVRLAGRYGIPAVSVLIAIAYVAVCLDA